MTPNARLPPPERHVGLMRWPEAPFTIPLFLAAIILMLIALYVWRRRRGAPGATAFVTLMVAGATWGAAYALSLGATDLPVKIFWGNVKYTGTLLVPAAWLVFALRYTGRVKTMTRPIVALLAIEPVFMLLLINRKDLMGEHVNSRWFNAIAWLTAIVVSILSVMLMLHSSH